VKDGRVTKQEFINYYSNLGASIDNEDYFELMIRNAWHLSGGEGVCAGTTGLRVLVTNSSGMEKSVEVLNDLGLRKTDLTGIYLALKAQGMADIAAINGRRMVVSQQGGKTTVEAGEVVSKLEAPAVKLPHLDRPPKVKTAPSSGSPLRAFGQLKLPPDSPLKQQQERLQQETKAMLVVSTLLDVLRVQLLSRGAAGIIELQRKFAEMDTDGSKSLDYAEFKQAVLGTKITFSEDQLGALFDYFGASNLSRFIRQEAFCFLLAFFLCTCCDTLFVYHADSDRSGAIDYEELLRGLRVRNVAILSLLCITESCVNKCGGLAMQGELRPKTLALVNQVFDQLDARRAGVVSPQDVLTRFDASRHPEVQGRVKTAEQVQREFLDTFDVGGVRPGLITREEFVRYYTNISASVNDDDYFDQVLTKVWGLDGRGSVADGRSKGQSLGSLMKRSG
jgi:Ca2+-binding EF-hand superfamily protein